MVSVLDELASLHAEMTSWRRHLHANPETAFEEHDTAAFVAERLSELRPRRGSRSCRNRGSRYAQRRPWPGDRAAGRHGRIAHPGGERTSLIVRPVRARCTPAATTVIRRCCSAPLVISPQRAASAARCTSSSSRRRRTRLGGRLMVEQGLFEKFPGSAVYGLHNWPGLPAGRIALRSGPMMAACDLFEVVVSGRGCHAAMPHLGNDVVLAASSIVGALHSLVGRILNPFEAAVMSITQSARGRHVECSSAARDAPRHRPLVSRRRCRTHWRPPFGTRPRRSPRRIVAMPTCVTSDAIRPPSTTPKRPAAPRERRRSSSARRPWRQDPYAEHGLRGLRLHAPRTARLLRLAWQRPDGGRLCAAQCAVRFQRRHPADRRRLLGDARRNRASAD